MSVRATRVGRIPTPKKGSRRACARCGVVAERRPTTIVCQDCLDGMSPAERALWRAAA
ncbi:hypothetical protein SEA_DELAGARZA_54 [Microbacterium phage DelaGarza]|nr:hypothetical protein SEA_DELAGARZA_54 [Microbacterium phage DelaGarza]